MHPDVGLLHSIQEEIVTMNIDMKFKLYKLKLIKK